MARNSIKELFEHEGHDVNLASWAEESFTLVCDDCGEILLEFYQGNNELLLYPPDNEPDFKWLLLNLLAVIHGDGGHYTDKHGVAKSTADAQNEVSTQFFVYRWVTEKAREMGWSEEVNCPPQTWLDNELSNRTSLNDAINKVVAESEAFRADNQLIESLRASLAAAEGALAECREAAPSPPGHDTWPEWAEAVCCPLSVPRYVKRCVDGQSASLAAAERERDENRAGWELDYNAVADQRDAAQARVAELEAELKGEKEDHDRTVEGSCVKVGDLERKAFRLREALVAVEHARDKYKRLCHVRNEQLDQAEQDRHRAEAERDAAQARVAELENWINELQGQDYDAATVAGDAWRDRLAESQAEAARLRAAINEALSTAANREAFVMNGPRAMMMVQNILQAALDGEDP